MRAPHQIKKTIHNLILPEVKEKSIGANRNSISVAYGIGGVVLFITHYYQALSRFKNKKLLKKGKDLNSNPFVFSKSGKYKLTKFSKDAPVASSSIHPDIFLIDKANEMQVELRYNQYYGVLVVLVQKIVKKLAVLVPVKINVDNKPFAIHIILLHLAGVNCNLSRKSQAIRGAKSKASLLIPFEGSGLVAATIYALLNVIDPNQNSVSFSITELIN